MFSVYVVPLGNIDIIGMLSSVDKDDFLKLTIKTLENVLELARQNDNNQLVAIFDLEDFNLKQFTWKPGKIAFR